MTTAITIKPATIQIPADLVHLLEATETYMQVLREIEPELEAWSLSFEGAKGP